MVLSSPVKYRLLISLRLILWGDGVLGGVESSNGFTTAKVIGFYKELLCFYF